MDSNGPVATIVRWRCVKPDVCVAFLKFNAFKLKILPLSEGLSRTATSQRCAKKVIFLPRTYWQVILCVLSLLFEIAHSTFSRFKMSQNDLETPKDSLNEFTFTYPVFCPYSLPLLTLTKVCEVQHLHRRPHFPTAIPSLYLLPTPPARRAYLLPRE
jgi:hypothetical protein